MSNLKRVAKCCCGNASVEVDGGPEVHGICHCDNCKQRTGSAFGISAYFKKENVIAKNGELTCYSFYGEKPHSLQERYFCSVCGTTLFWKSTTFSELIGVAGGCFVDNPLSEPTYSASCKSKFSWVKLPWRWKKYS